jgi:hypothetical protein
MQTDQPNGILGMPSHSWYFGNKMFARDLFSEVKGADRTVIPTRIADDSGKLSLRHV